MNRTRILLADDHAMVLDAFRRLLEPAYQVVATATDGHALVETALKSRPDLIVADIGMPRLNGLDACARLKAALPEVKIVFLTQQQDAEVAAEAVRRGASGYVLKTAVASELFDAIQHALRGKTFISPALTRGQTALFVAQARNAPAKAQLSLRQREVLQLLAEGKSMKEAADILKLTPRTIAFHKYSMMEQLGLRTGAELVQYAVQLGLTSPPGSRAD